MSAEKPAVAAAAGKVSRDTVEKAVTALLKWKDSESKDQAPQLLPQDEFIYLNVTLKKIPSKARMNPFRINLPHSLHDESSESCLIIDDRANSNLTSKAAKKVIKSQDISVSKVLKLSKLKSNYKSFESKRKLCDSYDLFLVDKRIVHFLPKLLGKHFFKKRKLPLPVDLTKKNWKDQIGRASGSGLFFLRTGTCSVMKVGKRAMESGEIVENVVEAINGVAEYVPKKWGGIRSLHLRLSGSVALPLYQGLPDMKLKIQGAKEVESEMDGKDLSDKETTGKTEDVARKKRKGRLHEVQYMDAEMGGSELGSDDEDGENEIGNGEGMIKYLEEESDDDSEENEVENKKVADLVPPELEGKKGRKGKSQKVQVLSDLNGEKRSKKARKGDNKEDKKPLKIKSMKSEDESVVKKGKKKDVPGMKLKEVPVKVKNSKRNKKSN